MRGWWNRTWSSNSLRAKRTYSIRAEFAQSDFRGRPSGRALSLAWPPSRGPAPATAVAFLAENSPPGCFPGARKPGIFQDRRHTPVDSAGARFHGWGMNPTPANTDSIPRPDEALIVDVPGYDGPLDLLLTLARTQKVDLMQISVLALAEQYLGFIEQARSLRIELAADYLVMAAWLAYLKSRLLLPPDPQAEGPSAEDLRSEEHTSEL